MTSSAAADPRLLDLAEAIAAFLAERGKALPLPLVESLALGMLERLKEFTTQHAPAGDVGRHSDRAIARAIGWSEATVTGPPEWIVEQLVATGILARDAAHRLIVRDWPQQCAAACHQHVADHGLKFADGTPTARRAKQNSPVGRQRRAERLAMEEDVERAFARPSPSSSPPVQPNPRAGAPSNANNPPPQSLSEQREEQLFSRDPTIEQYRWPWEQGAGAGERAAHSIG